MKKPKPSEILTIAKEFVNGNNYVNWRTLGIKYSIPEKKLSELVKYYIEYGIIDIKLAQKIRERAIYNSKNSKYNSFNIVESSYEEVFKRRAVREAEKSKILIVCDELSNKSLKELQDDLKFWNHILEGLEKSFSESDEFPENIETISLKIEYLNKQISEKSKLVKN